MIKIVDGKIGIEALRNVEIQTNNEIERLVDEIIENVRAGGDTQLIEYTRRFDHVTLEALGVTQAEIDEAFEAVDPALLDAMRKAAANIEAFHRCQLRTGFMREGGAGVVLGQKVMPLRRVGIYVPGGTASYPSTVLMNAIPAKVAGVEEIIMTTPPDRNGRIAPAILAAAKLAGVSRVFKLGGAQAIAALAFGTESVPAVDKIVGPGNVYVATAKRRVFGQVGIDMIAGPSEILIIADEGADARCIAADMLSQAEHDAFASAVLVTPSRGLAMAVQAELERMIPGLDRAEIARASIDNNGRIIMVSSISEAVGIANEIAPEHLELCVDDPFAWLGEVRNAGSVFLGKNTPEPLGDYWAGPNHTLPTSGTARFSSPLSVDDFVKKTSFIYYSREALAGVKDDVARFARCEGLGAHANAVTVRFEE